MSGGQIQTGGAGGVIRGEFIEGSTITFLAYLTYQGRALTNLDVQGFVSIAVYQRSGATPSTAIYSSTTFATSTAAVLITPSTTGWDRDDIGYNFNVTVPSTYFSQEGGMNYRFEFTIPLVTSGQNMPVIFELFCRGSVA